ncbi:hypothetical protein LguiA_001571 [Lonicera macranthoides]
MPLEVKRLAFKFGRQSCGWQQRQICWMKLSVTWHEEISVELKNIVKMLEWCTVVVAKQPLWLRSSLWLQFKPQQIAAGAAYLAAKSLNMDLTSCQNLWQEFQTPPSVLKGMQILMLHIA